MAGSAKANGRLEEEGWRPIEEATCPYGPCFLRLGPGDYAIGEYEFDAWHKLPEIQPITPTHFKDFPD